jgi:hypothetical protein
MQQSFTKVIRVLAQEPKALLQKLRGEILEHKKEEGNA